MISKFESWTVVTDALGRVTSLSTKAPKFSDEESRAFCGQVADFFFFDADRLFTKQRGSQHVAFIRQIAAYLLYELTDMSYPDVGEVFNRDYSTMIHAHKLIAKRVAVEPAFAGTIARLRATLIGEYGREAA